MNARLVTTPLRPVVPAPVARAGGVDPRLLEAIVVTPGMTDRRAALLAPDTIVVTTGQQPGLFTGPLYTIYKALSVVALARHLETQWQRPVLPVFWLATDDHDAAEANRAAWPTADASIRHASLPARAGDAAMTPMYREPLGAGVVALLEQLQADLPGDGSAQETMAWLRRHYIPRPPSETRTRVPSRNCSHHSACSASMRDAARSSNWPRRS